MYVLVKLFFSSKKGLLTFSSGFIRVVVDLGSILETLGVKQEHTLNG